MPAKTKSATIYDVRHPWVVDDRVQVKLEGSFLYSISKMTAYDQCHVLGDFIVECYNKETRTFNLGRTQDIRLYCGLEDIFCISELPVDGKPLVCDDAIAEDICMKYLGKHDSNSKKTMQVSKKWLRENFETVPDDVSDDDLIYYVRAYKFYLIGCRILPNCDTCAWFPAYWLYDIDDLSDVAWGAAALCTLNSTISNPKTRGFLGPSWVYEMFFFERIPKLRKIYFGEQAFNQCKVDKDIPLCKYYSPLMVKPGYRRPKKEELRQALMNLRDNLTDKDIEWLPYRDLPSYRRKRIFFSRTVMINFSKLHYHEPEKAPRQLNIANLAPVDVQPRLHEKSSRGSKNRKYTTTYQDYILMWNNRHQQEMCIKGIEGAFVLPLCPLKHNEEEARDEATSYEAFSSDDETIDEATSYEDNLIISLVSKKTAEKIVSKKTSEKIVSKYGTGRNRKPVDRLTLSGKGLKKKNKTCSFQS